MTGAGDKVMVESSVGIAWAVRSLWALYLLTQPVNYGSIAYEYEKNSYPLALADVWADTPDAEQAIAFLQQPDPEATDTLEIDLYSSFVLKGQMRKYFAFGEEPQSHGSFAAFQTAVVDRATLSVSGTRLTYCDSQGHEIALHRHLQNGLPQVWRDGSRHDWHNHWQTPRLVRDRGSLATRRGSQISGLEPWQLAVEGWTGGQVGAIRLPRRGLHN